MNENILNELSMSESVLGGVVAGVILLFIMYCIGVIYGAFFRSLCFEYGIVKARAYEKESLGDEFLDMIFTYDKRKEFFNAISNFYAERNVDFGVFKLGMWCLVVGELGLIFIGFSEGGISWGFFVVGCMVFHNIMMYLLCMKRSKKYDGVALEILPPKQKTFRDNVTKFRKRRESVLKSGSGDAGICLDEFLSGIFERDQAWLWNTKVIYHRIVCYGMLGIGMIVGIMIMMA